MQDNFGCTYCIQYIFQSDTTICLAALSFLFSECLETQRKSCLRWCMRLVWKFPWMFSLLPASLSSALINIKARWVGKSNDVGSGCFDLHSNLISTWLTSALKWKLHPERKCNDIMIYIMLHYIMISWFTTKSCNV